MTDWPYSHPTRGTCIPGCEMYKQCHCGCGGAPKLCKRSARSRSLRAGEPYVYRAGHNPNKQTGVNAPWSRQGVDVARLRPLLMFLRNRMGKFSDIAVRLDVPVNTLYSIMYNPARKRAGPGIAATVVSAVLAFQPADRQHQPRHPTEWEQNRATVYQKADAAEQRAFYRRRMQRAQTDPNAVVCRCGDKFPTERSAELHRRMSWEEGHGA